MLDASVERATPRDLAPRALTEVDDVLVAHVRRRGAVLEEVDPSLGEVTAHVAALAAGGKRLRAAFCLWGARAASGLAAPPGAVAAAAAVEMFHLAALVHDDVMDRSHTRRGVPTTHRAFGDRHRGAGWRGDARTFGDGVGVLVGDLCLTWSDDLMATATAAAEAGGTGGTGGTDGTGGAGRAARGVWEQMRAQVLAGQYLDVLHQAQHRTRAEAATRVLRYKSAKYTVEHPLLLGASLGGASTDLLAGLSDVGLRVGEAFQLRDDVLGLFGDPDVTGKPVLDDVREGKRTLLVAHAEEAADADGLRTLHRHLGDPHLTPAGLRAVQDVVRSTGALDRVERQIGGLMTEAHRRLGDLPVAPADREALASLSDACAWRAA